MRLRVSTGDECPGGSGVFQKTFFSGPNSVGSPVVIETPVPLGPRNCDQSSAATVERDSYAANKATRIVLIFVIKRPGNEVLRKHTAFSMNHRGMDSS